VAIVESEKTAILMSLFKPQYVWLATGSKNGFKYEYLKPIRNYKIIGFPDKGEYNDWNDKAIELNNLGFNISVSKFLESTNYKQGTDLADVLIEEKSSGEEEKRRVEEKSQYLKPIELINTSTEIKLKKLALKNTNIFKLVNIFQLSDANGSEIRL
jgi:hypothetical protein